MGYSARNQISSRIKYVYAMCDHEDWAVMDIQHYKNQDLLLIIVSIYIYTHLCAAIIDCKLSLIFYKLLFKISVLSKIIEIVLNLYSAFDLRGFLLIRSLSI